MNKYAVEYCHRRKFMFAIPKSWEELRAKILFHRVDIVFMLPDDRDKYIAENDTELKVNGVWVRFVATSIDCWRIDRLIRHLCSLTAHEFNTFVYNRNTRELQYPRDRIWPFFWNDVDFDYERKDDTVVSIAERFIRTGVKSVVYSEEKAKAVVEYLVEQDFCVIVPHIYASGRDYVITYRNHHNPEPEEAFFPPKIDESTAIFVHNVAELNYRHIPMYDDY